MLIDLPNDSDGDALRRLIKHGSDLSKPMKIDFAMDVPDDSSGSAFASIVIQKGFKPELSQDEEN